MTADRYESDGTPSAEGDSELRKLQQILSANGNVTNSMASNVSSEALKQCPLIYWDVKAHLTKSDRSGRGLEQFAVLGHESTDEDRKPVLLNTEYPWSAFLCGSQGSGKSHALSCMLENCLLSDTTLVEQIGRTPHPLAGLVFHYDKSASSGVCEAAYLCSRIPTTVLTSPSNHGRLKKRYMEMARQQGGDSNITVQELKLRPAYLNAIYLKSLMAVGKEGEMPLYMHMLLKITRDLAIAGGGDGVFDYQAFETELDNQLFSEKQVAPLKQRLDLLNSFLDLPPAKKKPPTNKQTPANKKAECPEPTERNWANHVYQPERLTGQPGQITVVDLSDPIVEPDLACVLFDICLTVFISLTKCNKIVALDEAHKFMAGDSSVAVREFTNNLLTTIREQRHNATRIVIATQEPTLNTKLLDLCSITMVHRCNSPDWFKVLKAHISAMYLHGKEKPGNDETLLESISALGLGECFLFCPAAAFDIDDDGIIKKMTSRFVKFRTRKRLTADGGITR